MTTDTLRQAAQDEARRRLEQLDVLESELAQIDEHIRALAVRRGQLAERVMEMKLKAVFGSLVVLMLMCAPVAAQHPCDLAEVDGGKLVAGRPVNMAVCQIPDDTEAITVYTNGVATQLAAFDRLTTALDADGMAQFGFSLGTFAPSIFTLEVTTWGKDDDGKIVESPKSRPFVLTSVAPRAPLVAPSGLRLRTGS